MTWFYITFMILTILINIPIARHFTRKSAKGGFETGYDCGYAQALRDCCDCTPSEITDWLP